MNPPEEQQNARVKKKNLLRRRIRIRSFLSCKYWGYVGYFEVTDGDYHPRLEEIVILLDDGVENGIIKRVPDLHAVI